MTVIVVAPKSTAVANVRLTNSMRDRIAAKVMEYKYPKNSGVIKELQKEAASIATAVYNSTISESDREKMDALPNGWLEETDYISVKFGSDHNSLYFNGDLHNHLPYSMRYREVSTKNELASVNKRIPNHLSRYFAQFSARDDLSSRFQSFERKCTELGEEYVKSQSILKSTLNKCTTTKTLVELWPEIKGFVQEVVGTPAAALPSVALSVPISTLNETFGLPVPA